MTRAELFELVYELYGPVTRARNCFLYTKKGIRLIDMYQENGRAIIGWGGDTAFTHFKNALNRGITGSFITEDKPKINKAISKLLNSERQVLYFSTKQEAIKTAILFSNTNTCMYKPWAPQDTIWSEIDCVVIAPPLPWTDTIYMLAIKSSIYSQQSETKKLISGQIKIPYPLECAITRSIYNLLKALQERQEKDWFIYDTLLTKYWNRNGPYLQPKIPQEQYDAFIKHCLKLGIIINPDYNQSSIVPFGADKGNFTKLKNSPFLY